MAYCLYKINGLSSQAMAGQIKRFRLSIYGILLERGRVLVAESRFGDGPTFINFPGGGVKRGEEPGIGLVREFQEETGLRIKPTRILYASLGLHRSLYKPERQMVGMYWQVERFRGRLKNGNGADVVRVFWAKPDELSRLPFTSFDREALPAILSAVRGHD
jgi:8-oxo-dGTP pyrophosphatase MutT (NUDIX family)